MSDLAKMQTLSAQRNAAMDCIADLQAILADKEAQIQQLQADLAAATPTETP